MESNSTFFAVIIVVSFSNHFLCIYNQLSNLLSYKLKNRNILPSNNSSLSLLILRLLGLISKANIVSRMLIQNFSVHQPFGVPLYIDHFFHQMFNRIAGILKQAIDSFANYQYCSLLRFFLDVRVEINDLTFEPSLFKYLLSLLQIFFRVSFFNFVANNLHSSLILSLLPKGYRNSTHRKEIQLSLIIRCIIILEMRSQKSMNETLLSSESHAEETNPQLKPQKQSAYLKHLPQINGSNPLSSLLFAWLYKFIFFGSKTTISVQAMPTLPQNEHNASEFQRLKYNFQHLTESKRPGFTLIKLILKTFYCQFVSIVGFLFINVAVQSLSPYLTALVMAYIAHKENYQSYYGGLLFATILVLQIVKSLSDAQIGFRFTKLGVTMTNSLTLLIFTKSLKYPSIAQKQFRESEIINYSQVDAERMSSGGFQLASLLLSPLQIIIGIILMYHYIGISFLSGIGFLLLGFVVTYFSTRRLYLLNKQLLKKKDDRMKVTQEMLDIIRYIKINSMEKFFYNKIHEKRMKQIEIYKQKGFMDVVNIFVYWLTCPLIISATFITYILLGYDINSEVAFTTIMIFTVIRYSVVLIPYSISAIVQIFTSIRRIENYLFAKEIETKNVTFVEDQQLEYAIKIERGNFYYARQKKEEKQTKQKQTQNNSIHQAESISKQSRSSEEVQSNQEEKYVKSLIDINTTIKKGSFTIIIGDIGSGKSTLLMAILNQLISDQQTKIQINGRIAFCPQKPWIMSSSVRDNITFQAPFIEEKLHTVIHYASLQQDLKILPFGVNTQIGEKGINISGGQKARISLARALYSERDIYLLDDILSAVDVHVGEFLVRETLCGYLKGKTILMPTHAIKYAQIADEIIIMKKGRIARKGHFRDICQTEEFEEIFLHEQKQKSQFDEIQPEKRLAKQQKKQVIKQIVNLALPTKEEACTGSKLINQLMLPQDQEVGEVNMQIFKQYVMLNGGYIDFALVICLSMLMWLVFSIFSAIIIQKWCENPNESGAYLYWYVALSLGSNIFIFIRAYKLVLSGAKQGQLVHRNMMKSLLYASLSNFFNRIPIGRIINRLTKDLRQLDEQVGYKIGSLLVCAFRLLGTLAICVSSSTLLILIPILLITYATHRVRKYYMKSQIEVARLQKVTNSPIVSGFISTISGLASIRAYRMASQFTTKQMNNLDNNKRVKLTKTGMESWFSINLTYLSFFVNMTSVGYCILSDNPNASLAGLLMNYAINLSSDIINFTNYVSIFQSKVISLERIFNFTKIEPQPAYLQSTQNWSDAEENFRQVIKKGQIEFQGLSARYRSDLPDVLRQVSLAIKAGEKIGIVGRTGAGKTTIINTILRITEISGGKLLIDGTNIQDYSIKDFRYGITMIDQEPTLIKSTFKENLDITGKYTDEQLYEILKECNLYDTIMEKGGLSAAVSNDSLSAGEKQLLCICRAFLKHSRIVLVDEATANIDVKNDSIIQRVISEKFKKCTVLTIAHRLQTLKHSDRIIVMQKGEVVQFGAPAQLQGKDHGWYKEMVLKNSKQFLI